jgi:hypothetical protein
VALQMARKLLIWALLLHLANAVWIYGDPNLLVSKPFTAGNKYLNKNDFVASANDFDVAEKLKRENVLPVALMLFLIIALKILWKFVFGPVATLIRCVVAVACTLRSVILLSSLPAVAAVEVVVRLCRRHRCRGVSCGMQQAPLVPLPLALQARLAPQEAPQPAAHRTIRRAARRAQRRGADGRAAREWLADRGESGTRRKCSRHDKGVAVGRLLPRQLPPQGREDADVGGH